MVESALPCNASVPDPEPGEEPSVVSPHPNPAQTRALYEPYEATPPTTSATDADAVFDEAWHVDEHGYIQMDAVPRDYWEIGAGCLIRHHVVPRRQKLNITNLPKDCPIGLEKLDTVRVTVVKEANGKCKIQTDDGMDHTLPCDRAWCGATIFQINGATRKEMAMYSHGQSLQGARQAAKDYKHKVARKFKKD